MNRGNHDRKADYITIPQKPKLEKVKKEIEKVIKLLPNITTGLKDSKRNCNNKRNYKGRKNTVVSLYGMAQTKQLVSWTMQLDAKNQNLLGKEKELKRQRQDQAIKIKHDIPK